MGIIELTKTKDFSLMSVEAQLLYFHLLIRANSARVVEDLSYVVKEFNWFAKPYLKELKENGFVSDFGENSVIVQTNTYPFD